MARDKDTFNWSIDDVIAVFGMEDDATAEDDFYFDEDGDPDFQPCDNCDLPDACRDFGCAIKSGIRKPVEW